MKTDVFCFTQFNLENTPEKCIGEDKIAYAIYQTEICPTTGKAHLQGYVRLKTRTEKSIADILPGAHLEERRGTEQQNRDYCTKLRTATGNFVEIHPENFKPNKGKKGFRSDKDKAVNMINKGKTPYQIVTKHPKLLHQYSNLKMMYKDAPKETNKTNLPLPPDFQLKDWYAPILDALNSPPNGHTINWIYDPAGQNGKTTLTNYIRNNYESVFYMNDGSVRDVLPMYNNEKIIIIDLPRFIQITSDLCCLIEVLKNGVGISGKYEGAILCRPYYAHVFVFTNKPFQPEYFSESRMNIIQISEDRFKKNICPNC